ncbi:hypothetical protein L7F22_040551 [Adiantum nelumboides]|nr:hypothetical protein [Adiantum nelumboides]
MNDGDVVLRNALLLSLYSSRKHGQVIQLFAQMQEEGVMPNECTFMSVMSMCCIEHSLSLGKQMHVLATSDLMHSICLHNAILTMYGNCFCLDYAISTFNNMSDRNVVTWTIMLTLLTQHSYCAEALWSFNRMLLEGVLPDEFVFASILNACTSLMILSMGKHIHVQILETISNVESFTGTALLNMYAGCGCLGAVENIFDWIFGRNTVSQNAIIDAFAHHGQAEHALSLFERMQVKNITADSVTFLALMTACSHCGLIEVGIYLFSSMHCTYSLSWMAEHFDCIIDHFGRAGQVKEAAVVIDTVHVNPTALTYRSLLNACCKSGHVLCGLEAAKQAFLLEPESKGTYFMIQNLISSWVDISS